jgi:processing peptidase subunit beta
LYNPAQVEAEKDALYRNAVDQRDPQRVVIEAAHYTSYRDHYLGQPVNGIRENIANITAEQVREFHKQHFVGPNVIVTGAGNLEHEGFVKAVQKAFGGLQAGEPPVYPNSEKPYFTPSIMTMRDDELSNLNVGVFFDAPTWDHPDALSIIFFKYLLGDYRVDKYTGAHLNNSQRQYNQIHAILGELPDVAV